MSQLQHLVVQSLWGTSKRVEMAAPEATAERCSRRFAGVGWGNRDSRVKTQVKFSFVSVCFCSLQLCCLLQKNTKSQMDEGKGQEG